ncbi:MAG TPA: MarC family protein [Steroidobacteraceae bacterium]|nr:MarC family protein [Steroidobacteraceae bacterium]
MIAAHSILAAIIQFSSVVLLANRFLLLLASALVGAYVLDFFGLSIPAVQVAGGAVVCMIGWSLLNSPVSPAASGRDDAPTSTPADLEQIAMRIDSYPSWVRLAPAS